MSQRRPFPPPSPALSPSLYSGMSSLQISQAGPGSAAGSPYNPSSSQPTKALLKGSKAARHQSWKSEHPTSSAPWKDPRQAAAASAGRKRTVKDDALFRQDQTMWAPLPPDIRPMTSDEGIVVMRTFIDHLKAQEDSCFREAKRQLVPARERIEDDGRQLHETREMVYKRHCEMEPLVLDALRNAPNEDFRQECQKLLDLHYKMQRDMEYRREARHLERRREGL